MTTQISHPYLSRLKSGLPDGVMTAIAALVAYLPAHMIGVYQGFWGAIIAISVVQSEIGATEKIARNQFIGAVVGGTICLAGIVLFGQQIAVYGAAVALSILACTLLNVASASRLAGITCTILMLVPSTGSPLDIFLTRFAEVCWGAFVGLAVVWLADRLRRSLFARQQTGP
jgi:uncharacterized membrane protein YgaE (UPF0421/DUF939 family)